AAKSRESGRDRGANNLFRLPSPVPRPCYASRLPSPVSRPMLRFILIFLVTLAVLFTLELVGPVDRHVIGPFTSGIAAISTWIIGVFDANAVATGNVIRSTTTGFAIAIERGCNGVEAVI